MSTSIRIVTTCCLAAMFSPSANAQPKVAALNASVETTYTFPNGQEVTTLGRFYRSSTGQVREDSGRGAMIIDVSQGSVALLNAETKEARLITIPADKRTPSRNEPPAIEATEVGALEGHPVTKARAKGSNGQNQEFWTATDLGIVLWAKVESAGLTTTRALKNVGVSEPDPSLFQIPADYTVVNQTLPSELIKPVGPTRAASGNALGQVIVLPDPSPAIQSP